MKLFKKLKMFTAMYAVTFIGAFIVMYFTFNLQIAVERMFEPLFTLGLIAPCIILTFTLTSHSIEYEDNTDDDSDNYYR